MAGNAPKPEAWFDRYVLDHGHDRGEPEPDVGIETNPDRVIRWNGFDVACEIKQLDNDPFGRLIGRVGSQSMKATMRPVWKAIGKAARQLKPLADSGLPLVVVLANPNGQPFRSARARSSGHSTAIPSVGHATAAQRLRRRADSRWEVDPAQDAHMKVRGNGWLAFR